MMKIITEYKHLFLIIISILCLPTWFSVVNAGTNAKIRDYKGDGKISYLKSPGLLGTEGFKVIMPALELSRHIEREYNLDGLPKGGDYFIYLAVDDSKFDKAILSGTFKVLIKSNSKILSQEEGILSSMICGRWSEKSWFYFKNMDFKLSPSIEKLSILASYKNDKLKIPISAKVVIERGGYK